MSSSVPRVPLCEELRANAVRVTVLWDSAIDQEPWILPRELASSDFVPEIVTDICDAAICCPPTRDALLSLASVAAQHASMRATAGADHSRIVLEYYLLRNALWAYFRERRASDEEDLRAILVVDLAISIATRAALIGYYRDDFEAQARWVGALDRLVDEVPVLWVTEGDSAEPSVR